MTLNSDTMFEVFTPQQVRIIRALQNESEPVSTLRIAERIYREDPNGGVENFLNVVHSQISRINSRSKDIFGKPLIKSIRKHGYKLLGKIV